MRCSASATCSALTSSWRSYGSTCHGAPGWSATAGIRSGLGSSDLDRARLGVRALALRDDGADPVARDRVADEDDVAVESRDARAAVGEGVDAQVELVAARGAGRGGRGGHQAQDRSRDRLQEPLEQRLLRVPAVLGLVPDALARAVEHLGGDLLARVGGQAVQRDRVRARRGRAARRRSGRARARRGARRPSPRRPSTPTRRRRRRGRPATASAGSVTSLAPATGVERVALRRRDRDLDARDRPEDRQRARDVVAVADVGELQPLERAERLAAASAGRRAPGTGGGPR